MYACVFVLQHDFVNRNALCAALMLPLITVLEAPPPKSRTPVDEDTEEEVEDQEGVREWVWSPVM